MRLTGYKLMIRWAASRDGSLCTLHLRNRARVPTLLGTHLHVEDASKLQGLAVGARAIARMFGTTQRDWALSTTYEQRMERRERSRDRWTKRRRYLDSPAATDVDHLALADRG